MKRMIVVACFAVAGVACASSAEIQANANDHLRNAQIAEAHGDYYTASHERHAANKQFAKAQRRAYDEAYYSSRYYW